MILNFFRFFRVFLEKSGGIGGKIAENSGDKTGGRLALCRVPRGAKRGYGRIRTDTDINGQVRTINLLERCDKPYHPKPRKRRYPPYYHPPVGRQPNDRRPSQRASLRGVIAPLFASFAEESATGAYSRTQLERRRPQGSREQARTPRVKREHPAN